MKTRGQKSEFRSQIWRVLLLLLVLGCSIAGADEFTSLCSNRAAIERIYHAHRLGTKQPFEEAMPAALLEKLVRRDLKEETVLERTYGVELTPAMVEAEVERINASTRAPEMLAEIKAALDNDPERFARAFARPIVVERLLRQNFENDDGLHTPQRSQAEAARERLLAGKAVEGLREVTWQLTPRAGTPTPGRRRSFSAGSRRGSRLGPLNNQWRGSR